MRNKEAFLNARKDKERDFSETVFDKNVDVVSKESDVRDTDQEKSNMIAFHSASLKKRPTFPLLAVDGGGTKTVAVITDEHGKILSIEKCGTSNYHVAGKKGAIQTLKYVINKVIRNLYHTSLGGPTNVIFNVGVFALAGIDTKKDKANVEDIVRQVIIKSDIQIDEVIIENDALSVLLGATDQHPGSILIAGTGSIAIAHDGKGNFTRAGGWGHRLGDEGAGYWIGKEAIRAILKMLDGRGPKTMLADLVFHHFHFENHEELYDWAYGPDYSIHQVGILSKVVDKANHQGDSVSRRILDAAVTELFDLVSAVAKRADIAEQSFKLLLLGGVLQNSNYVKRELIGKIKDAMPNINLLTNHEKPIDLIIRRGLSE